LGAGPVKGDLVLIWRQPAIEVEFETSEYGAELAELATS